MDRTQLSRAVQGLREVERPTLVLISPLPDPPPDRVALLAGSFDPITVAHDALAAAALTQADLVLLVYSVRTLPKEGSSPDPLLAESDRLDALTRFARSRPGLAVALASHGLLADQAAAARDRFPDAELLLAMGSDKVLQLLDPVWYPDRDATLQRLFEEARVLYTVREGDHQRLAAALAAPENAGWGDRFEPLPVPPEVAAVSSRLVRERRAAGLDVGHLVPPDLRPQA